MFKSKDRKPYKVISAHNIKCCESKSCEAKSALTSEEAALFSRKSALCTPVSFRSAQAANDTSFWTGGNRDFT